MATPVETPSTPVETPSTTVPVTVLGLDEAGTERLREGLAANPELLDRFLHEFWELGRDLQREAGRCSS